MPGTVRIGFAGTDARTLLSALTVSTARSNGSDTDFKGVVIRGTSAMPKFAQKDIMDWDVEFVSTADNSAESYATAIAQALENGALDYVVPMPEGLIFNGIVDMVAESGMADRVAGFTKAGAFIEGDKIACKKLCREGGISVADQWDVVDAKSYPDVLSVCLDYIHRYGGAVLKYPYSAGGKGARVILNTWEIREVYDNLLSDYKKDYKKAFKSGEWPLLIESRMSGVEISFTILVDGKGNYRVLPTSMDYPERFSGTADRSNPITGGMGSISPHPFESADLVEMAEKTIADPLVKILRDKRLLRPCILYPGCFASFRQHQNELVPASLRVCEINIRPGEPEFQTVVRRLMNPGALFEAMFSGRLDRVAPEVREDQISVCTALVTGPGGPDGQKGYPWRVTKYEPVIIDFAYLRKKSIQLIPAAMGYTESDGFFSDGTRVAYLNANSSFKEASQRKETAEKIRNRLLNAFHQHKVRVVPREDPDGNRLALREDIGGHFAVAERVGGR